MDGEMKCELLTDGKESLIMCVCVQASATCTRTVQWWWFCVVTPLVLW